MVSREIMAVSWAPSIALVDYMQRALPADYIVVSGPTLRGCPFDTIVVGPGGLFVLHAQDGPVRNGAAAQIEQSKAALLAFLQDEFPGFNPAVQHVLVATGRGAESAAAQASRSALVTPQQAVEIIRNAHLATSGDGPLGVEMVEALAQALQGQRLDAQQPAPEPFTFRSGGLLESGHQVRTVQAAVQHMDQYPEDGIFHLRNGSLVRWFNQQGAHRLAELAQEVMRQQVKDPREALESFLIGTGLVDRPKLSVEPKVVDLGTIPVGQSRVRHVRIQKGRGRGYLFGALRSPQPWLRIDPGKFSGEPVDAVVSVDTETLSIASAPYRTEIEIMSNAAEEPVPLPVQFRVVGQPSWGNRYLLRPLVGGVLAGVIGTGLGGMLGLLGAPLPGSIQEMGFFSPLWAGLIWAGLVGVVWAGLGVLRGYRQPLAWSILHAARRWLYRTALWGAAFCALALVVLGGWHWLASDLGWSVPDANFAVFALSATALAVVPATVDEIRFGRLVQEGMLPTPRPLWRRVLSVATVLVVVVLLMVGVHLGASRWQQYSADGTLDNVQTETEAQWHGIESRLNAWIDQLTVRYYERRRGEPMPVVPEWLKRWWQE